MSRERHEPYPHKTTDRDQFDRALEEARARGADDALLFTAGGHVAEAAIWAVFWWEGDRVCAPPLALGVLPSVARARVEELMGAIHERRVGLDEIRGTPLFAGNAVRGLVEVTRSTETSARHTPRLPIWQGASGLDPCPPRRDNFAGS